MKTITQNDVRRAISYIRFSTPKQEHGFSLVRQLQGTRNFCKRHNLVLDEKLTIKDLGKSAFHGKNADSGNLSTFLEAVRNNKIPKNVVLVVEALDRISRNNVIEATHLLTDILRHGIDIGLVSEDKIYSYDYINKNPFELIVATTYLIRGRDESRMKSERGKDAWERKKKLIIEQKKPVRISQPPAWLSFKDGEWIVDQAKVKVIRRIFTEYLNNGLGIWRLSHQLNDEKVPVVTRVRSDHNSKWHRITIHRFLTDKAVIGTYTNVEPNVEKYFPTILAKKDFYAVQNKLKVNSRYKGRHTLGDMNYFKGLCKCGKCGGTMTRITRTRNSQIEYRYLYCHNSVNGTCKPPSVLT